MIRNKVIKHILDWWRNTEINIVLCNASLHKLPKANEIVAGRESSIAVLMKNMNRKIFVA